MLAARAAARALVWPAQFAAWQQMRLSQLELARTAAERAARTNHRITGITIELRPAGAASHRPGVALPLLQLTRACCHFSRTPGLSGHTVNSTVENLSADARGGSAEASPAPMLPVCFWWRLMLVSDDTFELCRKRVGGRFGCRCVWPQPGLGIWDPLRLRKPAAGPQARIEARTRADASFSEKPYIRLSLQRPNCSLLSSGPRQQQ